jgi:hypothetical protein
VRLWRRRPRAQSRGHPAGLKLLGNLDLHQVVAHCETLVPLKLPDLCRKRPSFRRYALTRYAPLRGLVYPTHVPPLLDVVIAEDVGDHLAPARHRPAQRRIPAGLQRQGVARFDLGVAEVHILAAGVAARTAGTRRHAEPDRAPVLQPRTRNREDYSIDLGYGAFRYRGTDSLASACRTAEFRKSS